MGVFWAQIGQRITSADVIGCVTLKGVPTSGSRRLVLGRKSCAAVPAFWTKKDAPGRARHLSGGSLADLTEKDQVPAAGNALPVNGHAVFSLVLAVSCAVSRTHDGRRLPRS
jgi:hypothetical protein